MSSDLLAPTRPTDVLPKPAASASIASSSTGERNQTPRWVQLCQQFLKCHRRPINVLLHLITTPLGLVGLFALIHAANPLASLVLIVAYAIALVFLVPATVWVATSAVLAAIMGAVHFIAPTWPVAGGCLFVGYFGQDLAHWFAHERTLQSTYFSAKLGFDPPEVIKRFPYGIVPHPMVLDAMLGIAGMLLVPGLRASYAWLLIGHLTCYALVLSQEILMTRGSEKGNGASNVAPANV